ncbi:DUF2993 domain-containing protein [Cellulomonas sp. HZM]|uniref:LmeA family phospholipid-binding protein n=1 Tax=Cellulomonas sp. HZM TaxID=1454010 RepID=UPI000493B4E2|nr:DUF2993 domain-containing protein [Cellulomonas sp. HZM]
MSARGWVAGVVVTVVVLGGATVVADRWAAGEARDRTVAAVEDNLDGVVGTPTVDVGGFPFLPQLLRGSIDEATGHVEGATIGGIAATDVDVDARDVTTSEPYTAGAATIRATLPTASIEKLVADRTGLDLTVSVVGNQLQVTGKVLGVSLGADVVPSVVDGALKVDVEGLKLGGVTVDPSRLPGGIGDRLDDIAVPTDGLPEGMQLTAADVVADGLRVTASGTDVVLRAQG